MASSCPPTAHGLVARNPRAVSRHVIFIDSGGSDGLQPAYRASVHGSSCWPPTELDVCELSLSSYAVKIAAGNSPYLAIPIFPSRAFRHSAIYVRNDRGIERSEEHTSELQSPD